MSIKVKFFARMRDEAGLSEAEVAFQPGSTPRTIWNALVSEKEYPSNIMVAINQEYARGEPELRDGDELAFFPPVTGG